jgi:hypothetical protein
MILYEHGKMRKRGGFLGLQEKKYEEYDFAPCIPTLVLSPPLPAACRSEMWISLGLFLGDMGDRVLLGMNQEEIEKEQKAFFKWIIVCGLRLVEVSRNLPRVSCSNPWSIIGRPITPQTEGINLDPEKVPSESQIRLVLTRILNSVFFGGRPDSTEIFVLRRMMLKRPHKHVETAFPDRNDRGNYLVTSAFHLVGFYNGDITDYMEFCFLEPSKITIREKL